MTSQLCISQISELRFLEIKMDTILLLLLLLLAGFVQLVSCSVTAAPNVVNFTPAPDDPTPDPDVSATPPSFTSSSSSESATTEATQTEADMCSTLPPEDVPIDFLDYPCQDDDLLDEFDKAAQVFPFHYIPKIPHFWLLCKVIIIWDVYIVPW